MRWAAIGLAVLVAGCGAKQNEKAAENKQTAPDSAKAGFTVACTGNQSLQAKAGADKLQARVFFIDEQKSLVSEWNDGLGALEPICDHAQYDTCKTEIFPNVVSMFGDSENPVAHRVFRLSRKTGRLNYFDLGSKKQSFEGTCEKTVFPIADTSRNKL